MVDVGRSPWHGVLGSQLVTGLAAQAHDGLSRELEAKERLEGPDLAQWLAQVVAPHSLRQFVLQGVIPSLARR